MSDPIHSWVDPHELRRIGELLMAEPEEVQIPEVENAAYGTDFEGFEKEHPSGDVSDSRAHSVASKSLAEAKRLAEEGGLLSRSTADLASSDLSASKTQTILESPFLGRMAEYGRWLRQEVHAERFLLLDDQGNELVDELSSKDITQRVYTLGRAVTESPAVRQSHTTASFAIQMINGKSMEIMIAKTYYGDLILGLLVSTRISPETAGIVVEGLQRAVQPPEIA